MNKQLECSYSKTIPMFITAPYDYIFAKYNKKPLPCICYKKFLFLLLGHENVIMVKLGTGLTLGLGLLAWFPFSCRVFANL